MILDGMSWKADGVTSRTFGDRAGDILNVKDFGAIGDDVHDDGPNIQNCLNQAFGPPNAPHGVDGGAYVNRAVFFPAGNYLTNQTLLMALLDGAWIFGAGRDATRIRLGTLTAGLSVAMRVNYLRRTLFEDMTFEVPALSDADKFNFGTVAFYAADSGGNGGNHCLWRNCGFRNGLDGFCTAFEGDGLSSEFCHIDCSYENNHWGFRVANNYNSLDMTLMGGNFQNNIIAISNPVGSFNTVSGVEFSGSSDVDIDSIASMPIANCRSSSANFYRGGGGNYHITGLRHTGTGYTVDDLSAGKVNISNSVSAGKFRIGGKFYSRANNFTNPAYKTEVATVVEDI